MLMTTAEGSKHFDSISIAKRRVLYVKPKVSVSRETGLIHFQYKFLELDTKIFASVIGIRFISSELLTTEHESSFQDYCSKSKHP